jgi:hypothetical protein
MHALSRWVDEYAFHAAEPRRRLSAEVDLGAMWRADGCNDAWRLSWIRDTGELYVCRADGHDGSCTDVSVLAVITSERELDAMLDGWQEQRTSPDGLSWVFGRLHPLAA